MGMTMPKTTKIGEEKLAFLLWRVLLGDDVSEEAWEQLEKMNYLNQDGEWLELDEDDCV
jgi:hypothetical protein